MEVDITQEELHKLMEYFREKEGIAQTCKDEVKDYTEWSDELAEIHDEVLKAEGLSV